MLLSGKMDIIIGLKVRNMNGLKIDKETGLEVTEAEIWNEYNWQVNNVDGFDMTFEEWCEKWYE
jgi:hypothetical protein